MTRIFCTLCALLLVSAAWAQSKPPSTVKAIAAAEVRTLNAALAEPSSKYDTPPRIVKAYVPIYPASRLLSGKTGSCKIAITIGVSGRAEAPEPDPEADEKMCAHGLHALHFWEFVPASKDGKPVPSKFRVPFNYDIE